MKFIPEKKTGKTLFCSMALVMGLLFHFIFASPQVFALDNPSGLLQGLSAGVEDGFIASSTGEIPTGTPSFQKDNLAPFIPTDRKVAMTVWLLSQSSDVFQSDFSSFAEKFPNITMTVKTFADETTYFRELQKAKEQGRMPDIFLVNSEWFHLLAQEKLLHFAPKDIFSATEIHQYFHPIAEEFIEGDLVGAAPLYGNFVIMYANTALLQDDRIFVASRPGKTWTELLSNLTNFQKYGPKTILPISLGRAEFSLHTVDLFLLIFEQGNIENFQDQAAKKAFEYILTFARALPRELPESEVQSFVQGKIGILFGDESTFAEIKTLLRQRVKTPPKDALKEEFLKMYLLPQAEINASPITIGDVWGLAVSQKTTESDFAWAFITSLSDERKAKAHYIKTHKTSLLKSIPNTELVPETAGYAVTAGKFQKVAFRDVFIENVNALLFPVKDTLPPTIEEVLQKFSVFFENGTL